MGILVIVFQNSVKITDKYLQIFYEPKKEDMK